MPAPTSITCEKLSRLVGTPQSPLIVVAPEAASLLAVSLRLSRMFADDLAQLDAGVPIYEAFYRWARDAIATLGSHRNVQRPSTAFDDFYRIYEMKFIDRLADYGAGQELEFFRDGVLSSHENDRHAMLLQPLCSERPRTSVRKVNVDQRSIEVQRRKLPLELDEAFQNANKYVSGIDDHLLYVKCNKRIVFQIYDPERRHFLVPTVIDRKCRTRSGVADETLHGPRGA